MTSRFAPARILAILVFGLAGCNDASDTDADVGVAASSLTDARSVLGFETVSAWSVSAGTIASTAIHSEGSAALAVTLNGYSRLTSTTLSTLTGVSDRIAFDFRSPTVLPWGQVQLLIDSPTAGLHDAWVGQASVQGLAANSFSRVELAVPAAVQAALGRSYSDLRFKIAFNVPASTQPYVVDNLRFLGADCGAGSAYTLELIDAEGVDAATLERIRCTFYQVYPTLAARYNPAAQTTVPLTFFEDFPGAYPAYAVNGGVFINKGHIARNPLDSDVIVHEGMHLVQEGYTGEVPGWIIEGTADYVRDAYGLRNVENGWSIPSGYEYGQHYVLGYGTAAAFFKWIDARYRVGEPPVAEALDDILRAGTYSDSASWISLTGYDVDTLWMQYSGGRAPVEATTGITLYEHSDFGGRAVTFAPGRYTSIQLNSYGVPGDWVSSIEVPAGYTVRTYSNDAFTGTETVYDASTAFVGEALNDTVDSIIVE